ncbi:MAG TPA: serine/threonine-protein kinase [Gemmatimonadaceae bacterium]|nr:serine/threonine-protein kinase [Gemmatimonadaceae bacterium]
MSPPESDSPHLLTKALPPHLASWMLPPEWHWGSEGLLVDHRHYQEVIDALGRSLSLVSVPDPAHEGWMLAEARQLAHLNHPSVPTTYHYWTWQREAKRGPGYLRRWISGETVGARVRRRGRDDVPFTAGLLRSAASVLAYLHDSGTVHGAIAPDTVWAIPSGRLWLIGWQWAVGRDLVPAGLAPDRRWTPWPPEWGESRWAPDAMSDQWQLAAIGFALLTGELPPASDIPPIRWVRPDCPQGFADVLDRALLPQPSRRHASVTAMLRALDRVASPRTAVFVGAGMEDESGEKSEEARLRWAVGDDYEVLSLIGRGNFGSVWRVRDLTLEREVALKMLHAHIGRDQHAMARFRREAQLAAQLAHPAIVPVYDWDSHGEVAWYTMELAEGGSAAELVARSGPRSLAEIGPVVDQMLDGLEAAHAIGILHRDLKPENILIDRYRRWRLADFGIANAMGEEHAGASGTPSFAAPEQILGETQGPEADLFAVAAIVAYVLTGRPPFTGSDARTILAQQLADAAELRGIPDPVAEWLQRGLAADPGARWPDAGAMRVAWREAVRATRRSERTTGWWRRLLRKKA